MEHPARGGSRLIGTREGEIYDGDPSGKSPLPSWEIERSEMHSRVRVRGM